MTRILKFHSHVHSTYSDGHSSLEEMVQAAVAEDIDLLILTEHNTIHDEAELERLEKTYSIALINGIEYSTFHGHLLAWDAPIVPWQRIGQGDLQSLGRRIKEEGGLIGVAHPRCMGDPLCPGCAFDFMEEHLDEVDFMEVWHSSLNVWQERERNEAFYLKQLAKGHKLYHLFGGDYHIASEFKNGDGVNLVSCQEDKPSLATIKEIIGQAIRQGQVLVSKGPCYDLCLKMMDQSWTMGATIALKGRPKTFELHLTNLAKISKDTEFVLETARGIQECFQPEDLSTTIQVELQPEDVFLWVKTRKAFEETSLSNPIFLR